MAEDEGFPLEEWFDVRKAITRAERDEAEKQIHWYAWKDGYTRGDVQWTIAAMKAAIRQHNAAFQGR